MQNYSFVIFILLFLNEFIGRARGVSPTPSGSHSSFNSDDPLIYHHTTSSPYLDENASSALLHRPLASTSAFAQSYNDLVTTSSQAEKKPSDGRGKYKRTPESTARLGASIRATWTEERRREQSKLSKATMTGRIKTKEFREKMSKIRQGKKATEESKQKMAMRKLGKKHSEETKQKIREAMLRHSANKQIKKKQ